MKVRIEEDNIIYKISQAELDALLDGQDLQVKLKLLDKSFIAAIKGQLSDSFMQSELVLGEDEVNLNLLISQEKVQELSDLGRNKAGLSFNVDELNISLQVDLRSDNRQPLRKIDK
ncbi:MAG: hypothetical protein L3J15_05020 [Devosiaceae bacterium]|nr:hypothetical protein [Devosiaceae bacterium]